jgi:outer membrane lipoprotein SlyB
MIKISILAALGLLALAGCNNSDGPIGSQSVEWYKDHPAERAQQIAWCKDQSASVQLNSQACGQAGTAASKAMAGGADKVPRIILSPEGGNK